MKLRMVYLMCIGGKKVGRGPERIFGIDSAVKIVVPSQWMDKNMMAMSMALITKTKRDSWFEQIA